MIPECPCWFAISKCKNFNGCTCSCCSSKFQTSCTFSVMSILSTHKGLRHPLNSLASTTADISIFSPLGLLQMLFGCQWISWKTKSMSGRQLGPAWSELCTTSTCWSLRQFAKFQHRGSQMGQVANFVELHVHEEWLPAYPTDSYSFQQPQQLSCCHLPW